MTYADLDDLDTDDSEIDCCQRCGGHGEIRHPQWGARSCPDPTIPCPACHGTGGIL